MYWDWLKGGSALGIAFLLAVILVKPIGVSTQFVILDGIIGNAANDTLVVKDDTAKKGYSSSNAYLNKSGGKYAKSVAKPMNYSFIFVLCMVLGGLLGRVLQNSTAKQKMKQIPEIHNRRFGNSFVSRAAMTFIGGFLVLWGARLAGGCTSGHMMSGMMQTSISGYLFALATFAVAVPTAIFIYKK
jgi:uncharacterized membrane protein YedE/YeeE